MSHRHSTFAAIQIIGTMLSRVSGLGRLIVQGALLGSGRLNDIFNLAFLLPNLFRVVVAEEAIKNSFLPVYKKHRDDGDIPATVNFSRAFAGGLLLALTVVVGIGVLFAPYYVPFIAGGFSEESRALTVALTRIMFPFLYFMGFAGFGMSVLYCRETIGAHWVTSLSPLGFNGGAIALPVAAWLLGGDPLFWMAVGIVAGAGFQFAFQLPYLFRDHRDGGFPALLPRIDFHNPGLREVAVQWLPSIAGGALVQMNITVDRMIASYLGKGAITALAYAGRLLQLPIGAFGVSTAVSLHATLARNWTQKNREEFFEHFGWGFRYVLFFALPIAVYFMVSSREISRALFEFGKFDAEGTRRVAFALLFYAPGIVFYTMNRLTKTAFSAIQDNGTYAKVDVLVIGLNVVFNLSFVGALLQMGYVKDSYIGLAMGTSAAAAIQWYALLWLLRREGRLGSGFTVRALLGHDGRHIALASLSMAVAGLAASLLLGNWLTGAPFIERGGRLMLVSTAGWGAYLTLCYLWKVETMVGLVRRVGKGRRER